MSNQPKDLQKPEETKESFIEKTAKDALSKTIAILLSGGVIGMLSLLIAFVYGLPYYLYLPLGALAFFLVAIGFYLFSFRPTNKRLEAEISALREESIENPSINLLAPSQENETDLKNLNAKLQEEIGMRQIEYDVFRDKYDSQVNSLVKIQDELDKTKLYIQENQWLFNREERQREHIENYVYLEKVDYVMTNEYGFPYIQFALTIFNASVYDIALEETLGGKILFRAEPLQEQKWIDQPPPSIELNSKVVIRIHQRVSNAEIQFIKDGIESRRNRSNLLPPEFQFGNLIITIKGSENFPQVQPKTLKIARSVVIDMEERGL